MSTALCCVTDRKPKYLGQAVRWARALRWFGGAGADANLFVALVEGCPEVYRREFERLQVKLIELPQKPAKHAPSNKLSVLQSPELERFDIIALTDCDTVVVGDIRSELNTGYIRAKPADAATLDNDVLLRIFAAAGLAVPPRRIITSIDRRELIPYCNTGVVILPRLLRAGFVTRWIHYNAFVLERPALLGDRAYFTDQASFALALSEFIDSFHELEVDMNFPAHWQLERYPLDLKQVEPRIIHYHDRVDGRTGLLRPVGLAGVDAVIARFNAITRTNERECFDNAIFWDMRYGSSPELGSGIGSRGEHLLAKQAWAASLLARCPESSLIDFGCGDCALLDALEVADYTGIDASEQVLADNRRRFPQHRFVYEILPAGETAGDLSLCLDVLIHQPTARDFEAVLAGVLSRTTCGGLINGYDEEPVLKSEIVYYHSPLHEALARHSVRFRKVGEYRCTTVYEWWHHRPHSVGTGEPPETLR